MALPHRDHSRNVNGAHQDAEKERYQGPVYHDFAGSSVIADPDYVTPTNFANNGLAQPHKSTDTRPMQSVQVVIPSPSVKSMSRKPNRASVPAAPPLDYQMLLLSLAEDYFAAAHSAGSIRALLRRQSDILDYQKLIATGLSCLEASFKVW